MSEFKLFIGFFLDALKGLGKNSSAIAFGAVLSVGSVEFFSSLLEEGAPLERYRETAVSLIETYPPILFFIPIIIALTAFAKGGLIHSLSEKSLSIRQSTKKASVSFLRILAIEIAFILSVIVIFAALLTPAFLTADSQALSFNLAALGFIIFLPIAIALNFIEMYAIFYATLSKTSSRTSIELGHALFVKRLATSLLFGATSLLVAFIAAVFSGIILGVTNMLAPETPFRIVGSISFLFLFHVGMTIMQKAAWISFFRFIGTEQETEKPSQEQQNVLQREMPEIV